MLEPERKKASFRKEELSKVIYDSAEEVKKFKERDLIIASDPILKFDPATIQRSRSEMLTIYAKKTIRYTEVIPPNKLGFSEKNLFFPEQAPLSLH